MTRAKRRGLPPVAVTTVALAAGMADAPASRAAAKDPASEYHSTTSLTRTAHGTRTAAVRPAEVNPIDRRVDAPAGWGVHSGSPTEPVIDAMPHDSVAQLSCWVYGPPVTGPGGTTSVWAAVTDYTTPWGMNIAYAGGGRALSSDAGGDTSTMLPQC
ncbi:MAG TPA: hypothetical protein VGZ32_21605 [Actinocrinis sp.]|uniref:hypothetical protein n=1 Tax=Actinocrinis sp. TaxID=1920516 RepID=UPI002DDCF4C9|nr:hypothetical protein [Actinocrinis sp.]HEV3172957.1 hypothetical protein [Actinocrinis sp.]